MEPRFFLVAGWALIAVAAILAVGMHRADRRMQSFRSPNHPASAYVMVPLRWRRKLYTADGQKLVGTAWRLMALMYAVALAGMALLTQGVDALP